MVRSVDAQGDRRSPSPATIAGMNCKRLDDDEIQARLAEIPGWTRRGHHIVRTFRFANYAQAVDFANAVARVAERLDHHPDIVLAYGRVEVAFTTHDVSGITARDFDAAREVNALAENAEGLLPS